LDRSNHQKRAPARDQLAAAGHPGFDRSHTKNARGREDVERGGVACGHCPWRRAPLPATPTGVFERSKTKNARAREAAAPGRRVAADQFAAGQG